MEYYDWDASMSRKGVMGLLSWKAGQNTEESCADGIQLDLKEYKAAVSNIMNEGTVEIQFCVCRVQMEYRFTLDKF
jgi:hypothetical protein